MWQASVYRPEGIRFAGLLKRWLMLAAFALLVGCATAVPPNVSVVKPFDISRYLGVWYEIVRLDHTFERGMSQVSATYSLNPDGSIAVQNRGFDTHTQRFRDAHGTARFVGAMDEGALKVTFFWPFYGGYFITALDPDYQWSMVVGPDLKYFWILSRTRTLPSSVTDHLLDQAQALGVNLDDLIWVEQK